MDYDKLVSATTLDDVAELERLVRPEDHREIEEVSGRPFRTSILLGVLSGSHVMTARAPNGNLGCIVGIVPYGVKSGSIWMAGTPEIERNKVSFTKGVHEFLRRSSSDYTTLFNICDARNSVHVNWLRRTGFSLIRKVEGFGPNFVPVIEFARISPECATP